MNGLENLKKGDKVTIIHQHRFGDICIQGGFEVNHITATLVVGKPTPCGIGDPIPGTRVKIATGKAVGDDRFSRTHYYASNDPYVAAVRKAQEDTKELAELKAKIEQAVKSSTSIPALLRAVNAALPHPGSATETVPEQPQSEQLTAVA